MRQLLSVVGHRIPQLVPVLVGASFFAFLLLNVLPGGSAIAILGGNATNASLAELNRQLGLNQPLLVRYGKWLWQALQGNLGTSFVNKQPVSHTILSAAPVTIELVALAIVIAIVTAVPAAVFAARRPGGVADWLSRGLAVTGLSMPGFVLGLLLSLIVSVNLGWLPSEGFTPLSEGLWSNLRTMILPAASVSFVLFGTYTRILRADMVEQLTAEDYVLTARSKGLGGWRILIQHVLRNSLFSMITVVGTNFGTLLGATVIIEGIFGLPGIGQLLETSINDRDVPVVQGLVVVIAVVVVLFNLIADLSYLMLDPRVRYGSADS